MESQLLDQFGRQHCGVFLGVEPDDLEEVKRWLRLVDFRCEWVWGGREPCCQVLVHIECAVPAEIGTPGACHEPAVRAEGIPFCR